MRPKVPLQKQAPISSSQMPAASTERLARKKAGATITTIILLVLGTLSNMLHSKKKGRQACCLYRRIAPQATRPQTDSMARPVDPTLRCATCWCRAAVAASGSPPHSTLHACFFLESRQGGGCGFMLCTAMSRAAAST